MVNSAAIYPIKGGTGTASLSPPWSRSQVQWLGKGYYILRLASEVQSRWLLGAGFPGSQVFPHERTYVRSSDDKSALMAKLRMNPWPVHLATGMDTSLWRDRLSKEVEGKSPVYDTGYVTLWSLPKLLTLESDPIFPLVVLDGHHSRRAQRQLGLNRTFGWVEPLFCPQLHVRAIHRAGWLAKWIDQALARGELRKLSKAPELSEWTMEQSLAFEVLQHESRFWCEIAKPEAFSGATETVVDALGRLGRGHVFFKTSSDFEEMQMWLQKLEIDTALQLPPPTKTRVQQRAFARELFPQKATYFYPKIPFGILVEDLR